MTKRIVSAAGPSFQWISKTGNIAKYHHHRHWPRRMDVPESESSANGQP